MVSLIDLTPSENDDTKSFAHSKSKAISLPWWFRIVGWILLILVVLASTIFVTFYGITFQDEKCKKWITSMLISFVSSIFVTEPIKVTQTFF